MSSGSFDHMSGGVLDIGVERGGIVLLVLTLTEHPTTP